MVQHDMMMFDHGMPHAMDSISKEQRPEADVNIEFQSLSKFADGAQKLAWAFHSANEAYATDYPAQVGPHYDQYRQHAFYGHRSGDQHARERTRREIGAGWDPHWHQPTDLYATFSDKDFRSGSTPPKTTLGAIARLTARRWQSSCWADLQCRTATCHSERSEESGSISAPSNRVVNPSGFFAALRMTILLGDASSSPLVPS